MRTLPALWIVAASIALAEAQPADPPQTSVPTAETASAGSPKTTHFLIDASGSMEKRQTKLDAILMAKRKEVQQAGLPPAVETRFGGENGGICGTAVELGKSNIGAFSKDNDNTPLGAALEAALQAVGNGPADVFIFTDEEQTPGCGPDICTVAARHLPKPDVFVQSIPIDAAPIDHFKVSCIRDAQRDDQQVAPLVNVSINLENSGQIATGNHADQDFTINWSLTHFLEKWAWLIGFCCVAFSAVLWGQQRQQLAVEKETATTKLDRFRMAALVEGNEPARNQLRDEIARINSARDKADEIGKSFNLQPLHIRLQKRLRKFLVDLRWHWIGASGLCVLIALPLLSKGMTIWEFSIGRAQLHAWEALDSSFAEAFSLIAIAIVFFAGSQLRRHIEATQKYELANEKAAWAQVRLQAQQRSAVKAKYQKARDDLNDLKIPAPSRLFKGRRFDRQSDAEDVIWGVVVEAARGYAIGPTLDMTTADEKQIQAQTDIINEIVSGTAQWTDPFHRNDTARFLALVRKRRPEAFVTEKQAQWERLISALAKPSYVQAIANARDLAQDMLR